MREKKYINILNDEQKNDALAEDKDIIQENEINQEDQDDLKDELFKTREIKFRDLQDVIDSEDDSPTQEIIVEETEEKKKNIDKKNKTDETEFKDDLQKDLEKTITDDIYITTSFKPLKIKGKIKKALKPVFVLLFIGAILGVIGYFYIYPMLLKYRILKPDNIFGKSIDNIQNYVNDLFGNYDFDFDNYLIDVNFNIKTDVLEENALNKYNYSVLYGKSSSNLTKKISISGNDVNLAVALFNDSDNLYINYANSDDILKKTEKGQGEGSTFKINNLVLQKYFNIYSDALKSVIEKDMITSEKDEIVINQKNISVTRYSLKMNKEANINFYKKYNELINSDNNLLKVGAYLEGFTFNDYKDYLKEAVLENSYDHEFLKVYNIYLVDGKTFVGLDIEEDGFRNYYYYNYEDNFDIYINLSNRKCVNNCDDERKVIGINGMKKDNIIESKVLYNNKDFLELKINQFDKEAINLEYKYDFGNKHYTGLIDLIKKDNNYVVDLTLNNSKFKTSINGVVYKEYHTYELEKNVVPFTEKKYNVRYNNFIDELKELEFSDKFIDIVKKYFEI